MSLCKNPFPGLIRALKLATIEPCLFCILFGFTVRLVTFQSLLMDRACRNLHLFPHEICDELDSHKHQQVLSIESGNNLYAGVMLVSSLPAAALAVFLGPWSDKYSRKYPLVISASGLFLEGAISAALTTFPSLSPWWFVAVHIFAGISGGLIMSWAAGFSYLSDVTEDRSRASRYAVLESSNISAMIAGSLVGGEIFKAWGFLPVMIVAPCSFAMAVFYLCFFVKETKSRTPDQTWSVMARDLVTLDNIKMSFRTCSKKRPGNTRLQIWLLVWASFTHKFIDMGTLAVTFPFTRQMYSWDVAAFSRASVAYYVVNAVLTVSVVPLLSNKLHLQEATLGLIGMLTLTSKMAVMSVAYTETVFYIGWMSGTLNNIAGIAIKARLSKLVSSDELGRTFSLLGTCDTVTPLLGTISFVQMYNASASVFPGMPFAVSAVLLVPILVIFCWMMKIPPQAEAFNSITEEKDRKSLDPFPST